MRAAPVNNGLNDSTDTQDQEEVKRPQNTIVDPRLTYV